MNPKPAKIFEKASFNARETRHKKIQKKALTETGIALIYDFVSRHKNMQILVFFLKILLRNCFYLVLITT